MNAAVIRWVLSAAFVTGAVPAQLSQSILPGPTIDPAYYDEARDVLVCWALHPVTSLVTGMWEYDGSAWTLLVTASAPSYPAVSTEFDRARQRFVAVDWLTAATWEWDGANWVNLAPSPIVPSTSPQPNSYNRYVAYHETRQRVMLYTGDLYEWDGVTWTQLPWMNNPPAWLTPHVALVYGGLVYDARLDKLVLCGRNPLQPNSVAQTETWEWDAVAGWLQYPPSGPATNTGWKWFDAHRGVIVRANVVGPSSYLGVYYRDASRAWVPLQSTHFAVAPGYYDRKWNRFYFATNAGIAVLEDSHPASLEPHATGCAPPNQWPLRLAEPWSRAWLGETYAVDAGSPTSIALLAMGFSDQTYLTAPLPIDLSSYGLTGCNLTVAPEATLLGAGSAGHVGFTLAIPNAPGLLGTTFYQQAFAVAPAANAAGMVASDSVRGTIGLFR